MGTKTLTITDSAYERLAALKKSKDSFSDVVIKLTSKYALLDLVGILSPSDAVKLEANIEKSRKATKEALKNSLKRFT